MLPIMTNILVMIVLRSTRTITKTGSEILSVSSCTTFFSLSFCGGGLSTNVYSRVENSVSYSHHFKQLCISLDGCSLQKEACILAITK